MSACRTVHADNRRSGFNAVAPGLGPRDLMDGQPFHETAAIVVLATAPCALIVRFALASVQA